MTAKPGINAAALSETSQLELFRFDFARDLLESLSCELAVKAGLRIVVAKPPSS
jgi:hypothetical protein